MMNKEIEQQIHEFAKKRYQEGLNDAWECARKIICDCNYPHNHLRMSVVKGDTLVKFFTETSASEAVQEIKSYEEKQKQTDAEVRVGDEVYIISENNKSVVTSIFNASHGPVAMLLSGDAKWIDVELQYLNKTGKHYDAIEEVLKELRRDEE